MTFTMPQPNAIWCPVTGLWGGCVLTEIKNRFNPSSHGINKNSWILSLGFFLQWLVLHVDGFFFKVDSFSYNSWLGVEKNCVSGGFLLLNFSGCMTKKNLPNGVLLGFGGVFQVCIPRTRPPRWKMHVSCRYLHPTPTPSNPPGCFFRNSHDCGQGWCMTPNLNILNEALKFRMSRIFVPLLSRNISTISV